MIGQTKVHLQFSSAGVAARVFKVRHHDMRLVRFGRSAIEVRTEKAGDPFVVQVRVPELEEVPMEDDEGFFEVLNRGIDFLSADVRIVGDPSTEEWVEHLKLMSSLVNESELVLRPGVNPSRN